MQDFDIYALDALEPGSDEADKAFDLYRRSLVELFCASPEGRAYVPKYGHAGFWAGCLLDFGFNHVGVTLPNMNSLALKEIVSDYFPRKVSLQSLEEAEDVIPELIAFWRFLGREFGVHSAPAAIRYLEEIQDSFPAIMNDPSRFGMAKSLFMRGQAAGFDMTDPSQMNAFVAAYNSSIAAGRADSSSASPHIPGFPDEDRHAKRNRARRLKRKIATISKKTPRKRRK